MFDESPVWPAFRGLTMAVRANKKELRKSTNRGLVQSVNQMIDDAMGGMGTNLSDSVMDILRNAGAAMNYAVVCSDRDLTEIQMAFRKGLAALAEHGILE